MKTKLPLALALFALPVLLAACGGGGSDSASKNTPSNSDATYQAMLDEAEQTPVSDSLRAYAKQLCSPVVTFVRDTRSTLDELDNQPTPEGTVSLDDALTQGFEGFGKLIEPFQTFVDALKDVAPPSDQRSFHQQLIDEMEYVLRSVDAITQNGFVGALSLPTQEATPQNPPGFEAALVQECGEDLKPFIDDLGGDIFGGNLSFGGADATPTPPPPGSVGKPVRSGDFELTVHSFDDQYTTSDEYFQPTPGQRYVVVELSLKNISDTAQNYGSFDFKLHDADNFEYD